MRKGAQSTTVPHLASRRIVGMTVVIVSSSVFVT